METSQLDGKNVEAPRDIFPTHHMDNYFLRPSARAGDNAQRQEKVAMIMLNSPSLTETIVARVWPSACLKYCADGAANRLYEFPTRGAGSECEFIPDVIRGDLDSLQPPVSDFFRERGTRIERDTNQDTNDLDKCLLDLLAHPLLQHEDPGAAGQDWTVLIVGPFLGRLDQEMASYHSAYKWVNTFDRVVLLSDSNWAEPLRTGVTHFMTIEHGHEGSHCGLLALSSPALGVHTQGLQWNLSGETVTLGSFVSTSNRIAGEASSGESVISGQQYLYSTSNDNDERSDTGRGGDDGTGQGGNGAVTCEPSRVVVQSSGGGCLLWVCSLTLGD
mmetsp:Transcript_22058/g.37346  ORF Transcript_22058/g.37346 Transcript_22058/m.37346 type:complete len:331 (-) Transcript_22058:864-1856(-)